MPLPSGFLERFSCFQKPIYGSGSLSPGFPTYREAVSPSNPDSRESTSWTGAPVCAACWWSMRCTGWILFLVCPGFLICWFHLSYHSTASHPNYPHFPTSPRLFLQVNGAAGNASHTHPKLGWLLPPRLLPVPSEGAANASPHISPIATSASQRCFGRRTGALHVRFRLPAPTNARLLPLLASWHGHGVGFQTWWRCRTNMGGNKQWERRRSKPGRSALLVGMAKQARDVCNCTSRDVSMRNRSHLKDLLAPSW
mmetsp:Transcript_3127/g.19279  ORF Transcript_3127/g.19279 Transcript_3127/m.19279 type:complete len:254 (-) Transcript_3127:2170-2931(-)